MKPIKYILLCLFIFNQSFADDYIEISSLSEQFTIDTTPPEIEVFTPSHGDVYGPDDIIHITWEASDHSLAENPMSVNVSAFLDEPYMELFSGFPNTGSLNLNVPDIHTIFASIRLDIEDYYGNISSAYTSGYFTIGNPNENQYDMEQIITEIESTSTPFQIDTKAPQVEWIFPNQSANFDPLQGQVVRWLAYDENIIENPITISFIDGGVDTYILASEIANNGMEFINIPDITTQLGHFKVSAIDFYGNSNYDLSDNYMYVGDQEGFSDLENQSIEIESTSTPFTVDTKAPSFNPISTTAFGEDAYFYPNGGEVLSDYSSIQLDWNCMDESFDNGQVRVSLAYLLGGWYVDLGTFQSTSLYAAPSDFSLNGLVEETLWGRLIFTAIDDYGNENSQYNDDYFVLGDGEGDLNINWVDEDAEEIMINWGWESKHPIMITRSAFSEILSPGDKITLIDTLGINSTSCDIQNGYTELREITINDNGRIGGPKSVLPGINHCDYEGQKRSGFTEGSPIIFKITHTLNDSSYFVQPSIDGLIGDMSFTSGGHSVIRTINFASPITINNYTSTNPSFIDDDRDYDAFNVYNKVNAARDCDNPGTGENDGWCFDTTIIGETDYLTQVPTMTQSSILSYRVWLLDNADNEVFKTVDTEIEVNVELSNIYDESLSSGWNWFSLNKTNDDMSLSNILSSLSDVALEGDYIKNQSGYASYYEEYDIWYGTLDELNNSSMFKMNLSNSGNITFEGTDVDLASNPLPINSGWNWVAYLPQESMDINTALSTISTGIFIKNQSQYADYYDNFETWYGTLEVLQPHDGYMINANGSSVLTYPERISTTESVNPTTSMNNLKDRWNFNYKNYEYNSTIMLSLNLEKFNIDLNDQIGAFVDDRCIGIAKARISPFNNIIIFPMMMYGENKEEIVSFKYFNKITNQEIDLIEKITYKPDAFKNTALDPFLLTDMIPYTYSLSNPYPNPFNPTTTINYSIADNVNNLNIYVYDIRGRIVEKLHSGYKQRGKHTIFWNANTFASGAYFIKMKTDNHVFVKKIMLIK